MNEKRYQQVLEWEAIDELTSNSSELSIAILLYLADNLNQRIEFSDMYRFEVISFGWLGFYPAIGVQYTHATAISLDEDYMFEQFNEILSATSLLVFTEYSQNHFHEIKVIKDKILNDNNKYHSKF